MIVLRNTKEGRKTEQHTKEGQKGKNSTQRTDQKGENRTPKKDQKGENSTKEKQQRRDSTQRKDHKARNSTPRKDYKGERKNQPRRERSVDKGRQKQKQHTKKGQKVYPWDGWPLNNLPHNPYTHYILGIYWVYHLLKGSLEGQTARVPLSQPPLTDKTPPKTHGFPTPGEAPPRNSMTQKGKYKVSSNYPFCEVKHQSFFFRSRYSSSLLFQLWNI